MSVELISFLLVYFIVLNQVINTYNLLEHIVMTMISLLFSVDF